MRSGGNTCFIKAWGRPWILKIFLATFWILVHPTSKYHPRPPREAALAPPRLLLFFGPFFFSCPDFSQLLGWLGSQHHFRTIPRAFCSAGVPRRLFLGSSLGQEAGAGRRRYPLRSWRKSTRTPWRQFSLSPTRTTSTSRDTNRSNVSVAGWNRSPGATR